MEAGPLLVVVPLEVESEVLPSIGRPLARVAIAIKHDTTCLGFGIVAYA